jgi:hypothetical protein
MVEIGQLNQDATARDEESQWSYIPERSCHETQDEDDWIRGWHMVTFRDCASTDD